MKMWIVLLLKCIYYIVWIVSMLRHPQGSIAQEMEPTVDLITLNSVPKNVGNKNDGAGCCVTSAFQGILNNQCVTGWEGFREYHAQSSLGGGASPSKVAKLVEGYARERGIKSLNYVSVEGAATEQLIRAAIKSGRGAASTDGGSVAYYGRFVPHMTTIVGFSDSYVQIVDNNRPNILETITYQEWVKRHDAYGRWAMILLDLPVLPVPHNRDYHTSLPAVIGLVTMMQDCPGGICTPQTTEYYWHDMTDGTKQLANYNRTTIYGAFNPKTNKFYNSSFQEIPCPVSLPSSNQIGNSKDFLTGMDYQNLTKLVKGESKATKNGKEVSIESVILDIQNTTIEDASKPSIVLNGKRFIDLWNESRAKNPEIQRIHEWCKVYPIDTPARQQIADMEGYSKGITFVTAQVNGHSKDMARFTNESRLDTKGVFSAIIKADSNYKPGNNATGSTDISMPLIFLGALVIGVVMLPKKKDERKSSNGMD